MDTGQSHLKKAYTYIEKNSDGINSKNTLGEKSKSNTLQAEEKQNSIFSGFSILNMLTRKYLKITARHRGACL